MIKPLLENTRVLVCRAQPQADELATVLSSVGAHSEVLPTIEIQPVELTGEARSRILDLDQYSKVVVVSQHAAYLLIDALDDYWPQAPVQQTWFAIGRASSRILADYNLNLHEPGRDLTSEELLNTPALQDLKGEKVLIAKGIGGRSKLEQGLRDRGAKVSTLELYERVQPNYSESHLRKSLNEFAPEFIIALSNSTIDNLKLFAASTHYSLIDSCIVVPSQRVARHAQSLGIKNTLICEQLKPIDLIRAMRKAKH